MNGILAVNHFLNTEKFNELHTHLLKTAEKMDINLKIETNLTLALKDVKSDFVLFWDKDINLAKRLERMNIPVFNSADSIAKCDDKARTYIELDGVVPQPKTLIAPKCYFESDMSEFVQSAVELLGLPLVFKECFGSFGEQVFLCDSVESIMSHITQRPFILQKFVNESRGEDKRLEIVGGKCVACVLRKNKNDFRSNVTNGGEMTPCVPNHSEVKIAVEACQRLGLTFGGVDILADESVCEVNSNAHIINIMKATKADIAPLIFEEIIKEIE